MFSVAELARLMCELGDRALCSGSLSSREALHSCPTDCSPAGPSVHGILQARALEWLAIAFSRGSSRPRDLLHCRRVLYPLSHQEGLQVAEKLSSSGTGTVSFLSPRHRGSSVPLDASSLHLCPIPPPPPTLPK